MSLPSNFQEALAKQQAELIASNMANLASDHVLIGEEITRLRNDIIALQKIQAEIEALGSLDPKTVHVDQVKELHNRARKRT